MKGIYSMNAFKVNLVKPDASGNSGAAFAAFFVLLACLLSLSGCGRAKAQTKYDVVTGKRQNNAGTLSVILPVDISEVERKYGAAAAGEIVGTAGGETGAADGGPVHKPAAVSPANPGEVIEIKEKLFIAQTNDVYLNPEDYMGRTIKLEGLFKTQEPYGDRPPYCFVLRYGPGCCGYDGNAGFEVAWDEDAAPYPAEDDWVEAVGVLKTYEEDGYPYLYLALSSLRVLDRRGAEFVTQ